MFLCVRSSDTGSNFAQRMRDEGRSGRFTAVLCRPAWLIYFWPKLHIFPCCCCRLLLLFLLLFLADVACCCLAMLLLMLLLSRLIKERSLKSMPWSPHCHLARSGCLSQNDEYWFNWKSLKHTYFIDTSFCATQCESMIELVIFENISYV